MKQMLAFLLLVTMLLIACTKDEQIYGPTSARSLYPQNPLPPQVVISNPVRTDVIGSIVNPVNVGDTFQLKFSAEAGRTWWGGPSRLTKYRISFNNRIWEEVNIKGKTYSGSTLIVIDSPGTYSLGVSFWQEDNNIGSQGFYVINK
jgi:hypothetical protein